MKRVCFFVAVSVFGTTAVAVAAAEGGGRAPALAQEVERLAARGTLWPGFDPMTVPLAIYDGERTYLIRHPAPPEGFISVAGTVPVTYVYERRYPAVTSNSSAEIGGSLTATLLADGARAGETLTELATVALHEAFHVYQRMRHPGWSGNEGDLFLYPVDDPQLLALRRLETEAIRRALTESDSGLAACWTRQALGLRHRRFGRMDSTFVRYERLTELNEGLAAYVQLRAGGQSTVEIPVGEFAATETRRRAYAVGPALALLLDRFRPGWSALLEADDRQHLDEMLDAAVARGTGAPCAFTASETADVERIARENVADVASERIEHRNTFDLRPGWRVIVRSAAGQPLWPQGFDPLNIQLVTGGVLHTRFLRLGNDAGQMEAMDGASADIDAFTEGAGPHPLFNGVGRVVIAGLAKPEVRMEGRHVIIRAPGLACEFEDASVREDSTEVLVQLGPRK